jgi:hypothetical protein
MGCRARAVCPSPILASPINVVRNTDNSSQSFLSYDDTHTHNGDLPLTVYPTPGSSIPIEFSAPACRRLISRAFFPDQVISLIAAIFTSRDEVEAIGYLCGDSAQTFIDVVHEVRLHAPHFRGRVG